MFLELSIYVGKWIASLIISTILIFGIAYIVYSSLMQRISVIHLYARCHSLIVNKVPMRSWWLVFTTVVERNHFLYKEKRIVTIAKMLDDDFSDELSMPEREAIWVVDDNRLILSTPLQIHHTHENPRIVQQNICIQKHMLKTKCRVEIGFEDLHGKTTRISLVRLNNYDRKLDFVTKPIRPQIDEEMEMQPLI